jgi:hypothetical protein
LEVSFPVVGALVGCSPSLVAGGMGYFTSTMPIRSGGWGVGIALMVSPHNLPIRRIMA